MNKITVINHLDPRAGLWLLLMANIGMFCQKNSEQGSMLSGIFFLLMLVHGLYKAAGKGIVLLVSFHLLLMYVFPQCPAWMNMVFPVLVNYSLRMLPCVLAGLLLLRTSSMQKMIAAMVYTASTTRIYHSNVYDTSIFSSFERGVRTYKCCYETSEYLMGIPLGVYGSSIDRVCSQYIG